MTSKIKVDNINKVSDDSNIINKCGTTITLGASGDSIDLAAGASQTGFGRTGTVKPTEFRARHKRGKEAFFCVAQDEWALAPLRGGEEARAQGGAEEVEGVVGVEQERPAPRQHPWPAFRDLPRCGVDRMATLARVQGEEGGQWPLPQAKTCHS